MKLVLSKFLFGYLFFTFLAPAYARDAKRYKDSAQEKKQREFPDVFWGMSVGGLLTMGPEQLKEQSRAGFLYSFFGYFKGNRFDHSIRIKRGDFSGDSLGLTSLQYQANWQRTHDSLFQYGAALGFAHVEESSFYSKSYSAPHFSLAGTRSLSKWKKSQLSMEIAYDYILKGRRESGAIQFFSTSLTWSSF